MIFAKCSVGAQPCASPTGSRYAERSFFSMQRCAAHRRTRRQGLISISRNTFAVHIHPTDEAPFCDQLRARFETWIAAGHGGTAAAQGSLSRRARLGSNIRNPVKANREWTLFDPARVRMSIFTISAAPTRPGTGTLVDDPPPEVGAYAGWQTVRTAPLDVELQPKRIG